MQPIAGSAFWFERRLDGLRDHRALGRPVRFYFRRREQVLYLVVGGWNTVFGYAVWALMQFLLGGFLHYLVIVVLSWPIAVLNAYLGYRYIVFRSRGLGAPGAASLLGRLLPDAHREPRAAAGRPAACCRSTSTWSRRCSPSSWSSAATWLTSTTASAAVDTGTPATIPIYDPTAVLEGLTDAQRPKGTAVPLLTILTPCFNEEGNVREVYEQVKAAMATIPDLDYDHLFIDNASTDGTVEILRELAAADRRVQGHREHPQLRPHPVAVPRIPRGPRRRDPELRGRPPGSP